MGILDAPGVPTKAGRVIPARRRGGAALPAPPISANNIVFTHTSTTGASGVTYITSYKAACDATDLQLVYPGWVGSNTSTPKEGGLTASIPLKASIEINSNGTRHAATFANSRTATLDAYGLLVSNPLGVRVSKGDVVTVRTFTSAASTSIPLGMSGAGGPGFDSSAIDGFATYGDATDSGGLSSTSNGRSIAPILCGQPVSLSPTVFGLGDSITWGQGDVNNNYGWLTRALSNNFGAVRVAIQSIAAQSVADNTKMPRWAAVAAACSTAVVLLGTNDFGTRTAAQVEADLTTIYSALSARGLTVFGCTAPPRMASSSDNYMTVAGQTSSGTEAVRVAVNDWIRSNPAPLAGYFDLADTVEVNSSGVAARNGGYWKVPTSAQASVASGSLTSNVVTITTTAAHGLYVGATVVISGVGSPFDGAYTVASVPSTTTFTYAKTASNTTVGTGGSVNLPYTLDGTHPQSNGAALMAGAVDTSKFVA